MKSPRQILDVIDRYRRFYASPRGGIMTRTVTTGLGDKLPEPPRLDAIDWASADSCRDYARRRLAYQRALWARHPGVDDDDIPRLQNLAGTGAIAASLVRDPVVHHESTTNYLDAPLAAGYDGADRIGFDPENRFFVGQMAMLRVYVESWDGLYGIEPMAYFDPLDLANQFRGNDLFYDLTDEPEALHALLARGTEALLEQAAYVRREFLPPYDLPGLCCGCWCPAGDYLSCDAGDMMSSDMLRAFGRPYFDRVVAAWGGAFLHHHELGIHQIAVWADSPHLSIQFPNRDPNQRHLAERVDEAIIAASLKHPVGFIATYAEFCERVEHWAQGRFVVSVRCDDVTQAADVVRRAEKLRNF